MYEENIKNKNTLYDNNNKVLNKETNADMHKTNIKHENVLCDDRDKVLIRELGVGVSGDHSDVINETDPAVQEEVSERNIDVLEENNVRTNVEKQK